MPSDSLSLDVSTDQGYTGDSLNWIPGFSNSSFFPSMEDERELQQIDTFILSGVSVAKRLEVEYD